MRKTGLLVAGLLVAGAGQAAAEPFYRDVSSTHLPLQATGIRTMDVAARDVDADGDNDLVLAHEFGPNLLLLNDGKGRFALSPPDWLPLTYADHEDLGLGDLDRDGDPDILVVCEDDARKFLFLNDGQGRFTDASDRLPQTGIANGIAVGDVDGDGDLDVVVANAGADFLWINDGQGRFTDETAARLPNVAAPSGTEPEKTDVSQDVVLADLDGDSDLDMVFGNEGANRLLLNDGKGTFVEAADRLPLRAAPEETRKIAVGDVDGDGDPDLYFANVRFFVAEPEPADRQDRLLLNDGGARFTDATATHLPVEDDSNAHAVLTDLDTDGDLDLLAPVMGSSDPFARGGLRGPGDRAVAVLLNDGSGRFGAASGALPPGAAGNGFDTAVADFDGDGLPDIYIANRIGADVLLFRDPAR